MYQPEYAPVSQNTTTSTIPYWANKSTTVLVEPKYPHTPAYVQNPWRSITYIQFLSFFSVILLVPLIFLGILSTSKGVAAPRLISDFVSANPRLTPQIAAIFSSFLTASVKWALAGVVTIRAQKHFQHTRPIYNIEVFSAVKNGGVTWSWKRPVLTLCTLIAVILCGLLTSGFVALLSPFPIKKGTEIGAGWFAELDFSPADSPCHLWYIGWQTECLGTARYDDSDFVYSTCTEYDLFGDLWNAAKASMMTQFSSRLPTQENSALVHTFIQLANTRIVGRTAGTVPMGPAGVHVFPNSTFPPGVAASSTYNYTLSLQGIWTEASCTYNSNSSLVATVGTSSTSFRVNCPAGQIASSYSKIGYDVTDGAIISGYCVDQKSDTLAFYLRSFWSAEGDGVSQGRVYAGIDAVTCTLSPRIGLVDAAYQTDLAAFRITPSNSTFTSFSQMTELTQTLVIRSLDSIQYSLESAQTPRAGNPLGAAVSALAVQYGNSSGLEQNPFVLGLLADAVKGLFEYSVTNRRVIYTALNGTERNPACLRSVTGRVEENVIGWELRLSTVLGLIPLLSISVTCLIVTVWTMSENPELSFGAFWTFWALLDPL